MRTSELLDRLERHYLKPGDLPGGIFVRECGWNGGPTNSRCDALYVGFTSTSGRILIGHELKTSRADWLRELDQNGKADPWHDQCHAWYVVAPSTDIVHPDELPAGWGLLISETKTRTRMRRKVKPRIYPDRIPSWDAVRSIMARQDTLRAQAIKTARDEARAEIRRQVDEQLQRHELTAMSAEDRSRLDLFTQLEERLGVKFGAWDHHTPDGTVVSPRRFLAAYRLAMTTHAAAQAWNRPTHLAAQAREAAELLDDVGKAIDDYQSLTEGESAR